LLRNISASAKRAPGLIGSITYSCLEGAMTTGLSCPTTTSWNESEGKPVPRSLAPRSNRHRQPWAWVRIAAQVDLAE
jgi:hypothetical protein